MSGLKDRLQSDLTQAMKGREETRASTLRLLLSAVRNAEVAGKQARELTDDQVTDVLTRAAKQRREAAEAYDAGNRPDRAAAERAEAAVIADYLPTPLSETELAALVAEVVDELGVAGAGPRAMGQVMGQVQPRVRGRAEGSAVAAEVRRQLG